MMIAKTKGLIVGLLLGLAILLVPPLLMGAAGYGLGGTGTYTAATATGDYTVVDTATFTWATSRRHTFIQNHPNSPANLYIKINSADAFATTTINTTSWDLVLVPGQTWSGYQDSNLLIRGFCIYADAACIYGTDFVVKGVD